MRINARELITNARVNTSALPPASAPLSSAITDIIVERQRQQSVEGWTPEHDDGHADGQLATAASCYALMAAREQCLSDGEYLRSQNALPYLWPWDPKWWKPTNPRRDLVKAAALIVAEIERLDRLANKSGDSTPAPTISPLPVERDQYGYWTHPIYEEFCAGREHIPTEEFNAWMKASGLEWTVTYRDEEEADPAVDGYDISAWKPEAPVGDGWFVGSIHDTEDGAVCIWLRNKSGDEKAGVGESL